MTILSFADTRFPIERANGVQTFHTCHALAARGHVVTLLARPDTADPPRDPCAFYGLAPTATLAVEPVHTHGAAPLRRAQMLWAGVRRTLTSGADVLLTRDLGLAALVARLPAGRRPRLVYESHGIAPLVSAELPGLLGNTAVAPSASKLRRLDRRERIVWQGADGYVTLTRILADDLAARYGPRRDVAVVPDGAAPSPAAPPRAGGPLVAAYAGHLYPWKGVDVFLRALAKVAGLHGLIIGGHPGESDLPRVRALLTTLGLDDRVTITGLLPPPSVAAALDTADVLVLPNTPSAICERFTSPLKLFEYLMRGRPIVSSDLPALREVLTHNETALLVPAGDDRALAGALAALAGDAGLRDRLGRAALAIAPRYTWAARAERLEAAFLRAVAA